MSCYVQLTVQRLNHHILEAEFLAFLLKTFVNQLVRIVGFITAAVIRRVFVLLQVEACRYDVDTENRCSCSHDPSPAGS